MSDQLESLKSEDVSIGDRPLAIHGPRGLQALIGLVLNAINPRLGGILIRGEKGTAKSTAARGIAALLPPLRVVVGCRYACDPRPGGARCPECAAATERRSRQGPTEIATA